jgi:hypothetical protein
MKHGLLLAALFASSPAFASKPVKPTADQEQIKAIVETFGKSIVNKDKAGFLALFLNDKTSWVGVYSDKGLKLLKEKKKDASQPDPDKIFSTDTPAMFMDGLSSNKQHFEEKFSNVRIETDGNVGTVYFDYSFNIENYKVNWGKESWHLVHSPDGWKITSVIWSMDFNATPPKAK